MKKIILITILILILGGFIYVIKNIYKDKNIVTIQQSPISIDEKTLTQENVISNPPLVEQEFKLNVSLNDKIIKIEEQKLKGSFIEIDLIHKGFGDVSIISDNMQKPILVFDKNFKVTNGPDLFVYLSKETDIKNTGNLGEFVSLGTLKSNTGEQFYNLPNNYQEYKSVVIWCRAFGVLFSVAELSI